MSKLFNALLAMSILLMIVGCSSKVHHPQAMSESTTETVYNKKFSKVDLTVNEDATKDPNDIVRFDDAKLRNMIEKKLSVSGLITEDSNYSIKIEINDIRIRSSFNAFMWGIMAGADHIKGTVMLLDENKTPFHTFDVSAMYGLGGFAGFNETRMGWLFEEFSKLTLDEIAGKQVAKKD